jgi:PEP-CTERM motif
VLATGLSAATIASDNASNYGGTWTNGSNLGTGFQAWDLTSSGGTGGFGGAEMKNPAADGGITGMGTTSFTLYADPSGSGAYSNAARAFAAAMNVGDTFTVQLGINYDSGSTGNKGISLYTGGTGGTQLININNAGSPTITINGATMFAAYGQNAMTISFTLQSATTLAVSSNSRNGIEPAYNNTFTIAGAPDAFKLYASDLQGGSGNLPKPYLNNLQIVSVPEPSALALIGLGLAAFGIRRKTKIF